MPGHPRRKTFLIREQYRHFVTENAQARRDEQRGQDRRTPVWLGVP